MSQLINLLGFAFNWHCHVEVNSLKSHNFTNSFYCQNFINSFFWRFWDKTWGTTLLIRLYKILEEGGGGGLDKEDEEEEQEEELLCDLLLLAS